MTRFLRSAFGVIIFFLVTCVHVSHAQDLEVTASERIDATGRVIAVRVMIPEHHYVYAQSFSVEGSEGTMIERLDVPVPEVKNDPFSNQPVEVYLHSFTATYRIVSAPSADAEIVVNYQGCNADTCFLPQTEDFEFSGGQVTSSEGDDEVADDDEDPWEVVADQFETAATETGFMSVKKTLAFLAAGQEGEEHSGLFNLEKRNFWVAIGLILLGGLALNLTPCVLPMLPINLAIIGAGAQAGSRQRGFLLGGVYGAGIALTYGILGVVVVLTGSTFGSLNASPWFNFGIAAVFVVLALGMFDIIHIDFARFQRAGTTQKKRGAGLAFSMGVVAALLAGACVAPVVISVLLWAGSLYGRGVTAGLILPFVLGAGMALPWPFAGAGLSFLPKPGKWMVWVRNGFGVLILGMAIWYAVQAYHMCGITSVDHEGKSTGDESAAALENQKLARQLSNALREDRPVFLGFGASWCKNCKAMTVTTLQNERVLAELEDFEFIYYNAEKPKDEETKEVLEHFKIQGLPTYLILQPRD